MNIMIRKQHQRPSGLLRSARVRFGLLSAAVLGFVAAQVSAGTIAGTPHDLSAKGWGTTETCKFCHTPHQAQVVAGGGSPLWNHKTTAVATYTLYSSPSFSASITQPGPTSKLCLSCHDGTVAVDSFANRGVLVSGTHFITATNMVGGGGNLASDHPIAFTYDAALASADGGLVTPVSTNYVDSLRQVPLYNGKMECASCHTSHDNAFGNFLRMSNASSALCSKCHVK